MYLGGHFRHKVLRSKSSRSGSQSTDEAQDDDGEGEQSCTAIPANGEWLRGIRNAGQYQCISGKHPELINMQVGRCVGKNLFYYYEYGSIKEIFGKIRTLF